MKKEEKKYKWVSLYEDQEEEYRITFFAFPSDLEEIKEFLQGFGMVTEVEKKEKE